MKQRKQLLAMMLISALVLSMFSGTATEAKKKKKLKFNKTKITMYTDTDASLKIKNNTKVKSVKWRSSNKKVVYFVAKSEQDCRLQARKVGTATITAKIGKVKLKCKVKVKKNKGGSPYTAPITRSLTASNTNIEIKEGESAEVQITVLPMETVKWEASNDCCTAKWGDVSWLHRSIPLTITGDKAGESTITVYNENHPEISTTIHVKVISLVSVQLPQTPLTLSDEGWQSTQIYNITNMYYTATKDSSGNYTIKIYFSGNKVYDSRGTHQSSDLRISWKLCRGNVVIGSGSVYTPSLLTGEAFENENASIYSIPPGEYELQVLSTN